MSKEMEFFIYLLENYANFKHKSASDVLKTWDSHNITGQIYNNYWGYHTEKIENAYEDIDRLLYQASKRNHK